MKRILPGVFVCCLWQMGWGQVGEWTWMKGDTISNRPGVYGIKGVGAAANNPGSRESAASWKDASGNIWMLGGNGYSNSVFGLLSDLWKYDVVSNQWIWMQGDSTTNTTSFYTAIGVPSPLNNPGSRASAASWVDKSGNFWLYGGYDSIYPSYGPFRYLGDLWKFDPLLHQWTCVDTSSKHVQATYLTRGIPGGRPGTRYSACTWCDSSGNLWLMGGVIPPTPTIPSYFSYKNDLWKYSIANNQWTWIKGDSLAGINVLGVYGPNQVFTTTARPGPRYAAVSWIDSLNHLWLYSGYGNSRANQGNLNDVWEYDIATNNWAFMGGNSYTDGFGIYGTKGVPSVNNLPRSRCFSGGDVDAHNNLWVFGGKNVNSPNSDFLNDLWKFNSYTYEWTWVSGDNALNPVGVFGTQGASSPAGKPGGISDHVFKIEGNNLRAFGGVYGKIIVGLDYSNLLWKYVIQTVTPLHLLTLTAKRANIANLLNWTTAQEVNTDRFDIERSPNGREFSKIGTVKANSINRQYEYTDNNPTTTPNSKPQTIFYRLRMLDKDGQFTYSPIRQININHSTFNIALFPNPAKDILQLQIESDQKTTFNLQVLAQDGKIFLSKQVTVQQGSSLQSINISSLAAGHYFLKALSAGKEPVVVGFEKVR